MRKVYFYVVTLLQTSIRSSRGETLKWSYRADPQVYKYAIHNSEQRQPFQHTKTKTKSAEFTWDIQKSCTEEK